VNGKIGSKQRIGIKKISTRIAYHARSNHDYVLVLPCRLDFDFDGFRMKLIIAQSFVFNFFDVTMTFLDLCVVGSAFPQHTREIHARKIFLGHFQFVPV
jgi:hypothetical protein